MPTRNRTPWPATVLLAALALTLGGCDRGPRPADPAKADHPTDPAKPADDPTRKPVGTDPKIDTSPPKVYAVLVSDPTGAATVSGVTLDVAKNPLAVRELLTSGIGADRLVVVPVEGSAAAAAEIERAIRELPVRPIDTVFCYVSGLGLHNSTEPDGFAFSLHGGPKKYEPLARSTLRKWLSDKKARLTVLLSDTAATAAVAPRWPLALGPSATVAGVPKDIVPGSLGGPPAAAAVRPGFQALFFDAAGLLDWAGADERQSCWGPVGETGFFTRAFVRAVFDARETPGSTWAGVYAITRADTTAGYTRWRAAELGRLRPKANPSSNEVLSLGMLRDQKGQSSRAYYLPGTELKMITVDVPGGVQVAELPLDSPCRAAGIVPGELVIAVQDRPTATVEEWMAAAGGAIRAGQRKLMFRIRGFDGAVRDVVVELPN